MGIEIEKRQIATEFSLIENREDQTTKEPVIEGYALKFNKWSQELGFFTKFREKLDPNCLDETDFDNVVALFNHDNNKVLGRNKINLDLEIDNIGLKFRINPSKTSYTQDLLENIRLGIINQCSFAFSLNYDDENAQEITYNKEEDIHERIVKKIEKLYDVSVVTTPAYEDTEVVVGKRTLELFKRSKEAIEPSVDKEKELEQLDLEAQLYFG